MSTNRVLLVACVLIFMCTIPLNAAEGRWQIVGTISGNGVGDFVDPTGLTFDGTYIWAVEQHANVAGVPLYKIDPTTMSVIETINLNLTNCCVQGLAWDGQYIWISDVGYYIYRFDPVTHDLQQTCTRQSNPQPIGLTWVNGVLYGTGWQGNIPPEHILALNTSDCSYQVVSEIAGVANCGITYNGTDFLVCGMHQDWSPTKKQLMKYSVAGELLLEYEPFNFQAYDLAWDGQYLWVCDYGPNQYPPADGHIYKIKLFEPQFMSLKVIEQTGSIDTYSFDSLDPRLYESIADLGPSHNDFGTGGCEYYDIFFSDKSGNCLTMQPGDRLPDPVYVTIKCMDLNCNNGLPDPAPSWDGAGNNLDAVVLELFDGSRWAVELTQIQYGLCEQSPRENINRVAEKVLGQADGVITGMGGGLTGLTMRLGTLEPFACAGLNNATIIRPACGSQRDVLHIWNAPVLFPVGTSFDSRNDQIRVCIDGTEIVIPPGATMKLGRLPIYVYFSRVGMQQYVLFTLNLLFNQWSLNTSGISIAGLENTNGVTVDFSCGNYFYEKTMFMDERTGALGKMYSYHQQPPTECGKPLVNAFATDLRNLLNADAFTNIAALKKSLISALNEHDAERVMDWNVRSRAIDEIQSLPDCVSESGISEEKIQSSLVAYADYMLSSEPKDAMANADRVVLHQNLPNPFNPSTTIRFYLPKSMDVQLKIYNVSGEEVATLLDAQMKEGTHTAIWNGRDNHGELVASGMYFYRLTAGSIVKTMKMVMIR